MNSFGSVVCFVMCQMSGTHLAAAQAANRAELSTGKRSLTMRERSIVRTDEACHAYAPKF
jgi:hypothetical protein